MQNFTVLMADPADALLPEPIVGGQQSSSQQGNTNTEVGTQTDPTVGGSAQVDPMSGMWIWIIWIPLMIGMYFLMTRGQRKREKQMKEMQSNIKAGDNVITAGGFFGRVADVGEDCFVVEFGTNRGIRIPVQKTDVVAIRSPKMTPVHKDGE